MLSLTTCAYCFGFKAQHKDTNTAFQPHEGEEGFIGAHEHVFVDTFERIILLLFSYSYKAEFYKNYHAPLACFMLLSTSAEPRNFS